MRLTRHQSLLLPVHGRIAVLQQIAHPICGIPSKQTPVTSVQIALIVRTPCVVCLTETFRPWCYLRHALCGLAPTPTRLSCFVSSDIATIAVAVAVSSRAPTCCGMGQSMVNMVNYMFLSSSNVCCLTHLIFYSDSPATIPTAPGTDIADLSVRVPIFEITRDQIL